MSLLTGACSSGDDTIPDASSGTTTSTSSASTSEPGGSTISTASPADENAQVRAAYVGFWEARFRANEVPVNPDLPALREFATGQQLENVVSETAKRKADGLAFRQPSQPAGRREVEIVEIAGDTAQVRECSVNDGVVYRVASGEVVDGSIVTHSVDGVLRRVDGRWKVESTRLIQKWEGIAGCALAE